MPFSMYKGKEKATANEEDAISRSLARYPPIRPTRMKMEIVLEKEEEN